MCPPNTGIPEKLKNPHPLVAQSMEILGTGKTDRNGLLKLPGEHCLDIRVSPESLPRAFRIWDSLIKALNEGGFCFTFYGTWFLKQLAKSPGLENAKSFFYKLSQNQSSLSPKPFETCRSQQRLLFNPLIVSSLRTYVPFPAI
jgi:hypothetical protein